MNAFEAGRLAHNYAVLNNITNRSNYVVIDFTLPSTSARLYVYDEDGKMLFNTFVTHGEGSGGLYAKQFSNINNSHQSNIGVGITVNTYVGKHGLSRRLKGLEYTNDNMFSRAIVIHSANYIGDGKSGRSWGCPAVPIKDIDDVLEYTKPGTIIVFYYPDPKWLSTSKFLNGDK